MKPFGECPTCGGVLFEGHSDGKHAHLSGLKAEDYEKLEAEVAQLRADGQRLRDVLRRIIADGECESAVAPQVSGGRTCLELHLVAPCPNCLAQEALAPSGDAP